MNRFVLLRRSIVGVFLLMQITNGFAQLPEVPRWVHDLYNEVMVYVGKVEQEKKFNPPPPPSTYYDYCFPCDKERKAAYIRDSVYFINSYLAEELFYQKKADDVMSYFNELRSKKKPFDSLAFLRMAPDMYRAKLVIALRLQDKLLAAWNQYHDQPEKVPFLIHQMRAQHRVNELVGMQSQSRLPSDGILLQLLVFAAKNKLAKAREERDYPILLNIARIYELFRSAELIGLTSEHLGDDLSNYSRTNQFEVTVETRAKTKGKGGGYYAAGFRTKAIYLAVPDSNCQLKWKLPEEKQTRLPFDLDDLSMRLPKGEAPTYDGTKIWSSALPEIKLDFCNDQRDTAHFYGFNSGPNGAGVVEQWSLGGNSFSLAVTLAVFSIAFPDPKQYQQYTSGRSATATPNPYSFLVKQVPKNKSKVILEKELDGKDGPNAKFIDYAKFKLKIEHVE